LVVKFEANIQLTKKIFQTFVGHVFLFFCRRKNKPNKPNKHGEQRIGSRD